MQCGDAYAPCEKKKNVYEKLQGVCDPVCVWICIALKTLHDKSPFFQP